MGLTENTPGIMRPAAASPSRRQASVWLAALALAAAGTTASAQDTTPAAPAGSISLELNKAGDEAGACRTTFVAVNRLGGALDELAYEIVVFDGDGLVDRLVRFDFGAMAADKTTVKRFDLPGLSCGAVGRLLVNDAAACKGDGVEPQACLAGLKTASRTSILFGR
ncbi:hypothetical protein DFR52_101535 [Hoeflea marina]|uniref:Tat pathway signal sequence domain protein n=1 Tax=Hoeflea marina TaxID=274592 RepID=A0A317PUC5_9HYPH|nr:hypothetical protein [Hoeflea marina]PWW03846.1 hypothetical protein DFR52_101535 [Hoeflea marina]